MDELEVTELTEVPSVPSEEQYVEVELRGGDFVKVFVTVVVAQVTTALALSMIKVLINRKIDRLVKAKAEASKSPKEN